MGAFETGNQPGPKFGVKESRPDQTDSALRPPTHFVFRADSRGLSVWLVDNAIIHNRLSSTDTQFKIKRKFSINTLFFIVDILLGSLQVLDFNGKDAFPLQLHIK